MQAIQEVTYKENELFKLNQKVAKKLMINRIILSLMVLAPLFEIYQQRSFQNYYLLGIYSLIILSYLIGAFLYTSYLSKAIIGLFDVVIVLEIIAMIIAQTVPSLMSIQFKIAVGIGLAVSFFEAKNISLMNGEINDIQLEIEQLKDPLTKRYKTLKGLRVYVNYSQSS